MSNDETTDERSAREKFVAWLREIEAAAAELVQLGDALFKDGEPTDPALHRRQRLYKRAKAAVALPPGPERVAALQAAKIDRQHQIAKNLAAAADGIQSAQFSQWPFCCDPQMTIYRARYRHPKEHRWISEWAETRVAAEFHRAEIERRFAPKKLEIAIERFELNPGKSDVVRLLNEHGCE